jgi:hypothetical protein
MDRGCVGDQPQHCRITLEHPSDSRRDRMREVHKGFDVQSSSGLPVLTLQRPFPPQRLSLNAFPITTKSENPIAAAHRIGLMNPSAASGIPIAL